MPSRNVREAERLRGRASRPNIMHAEPSAAAKPGSGTAISVEGIFVSVKAAVTAVPVCMLTDQAGAVMLRSTSPSRIGPSCPATAFPPIPASSVALVRETMSWAGSGTKP